MTDLPFIQLRRVDKAYRRGSESVSVLRGLDLDIGRGDFVAMMGPSGSGKTTLLNLVGGLDRADRGQIVVGSHGLEGMSADALARWRAEHVGFVFQSYNLLDGLTAARNVELPLLVTRLPAAQRASRVQAALGVVGLADRLRHRPSQLSGGQQQRVAIARAIISDPDVLLCDEPTGDLDRETANQVLALLRDLNQSRGKTILMVTHDPLAAAYARRTIHVDKGTVVSRTVEPSGLPAPEAPAVPRPVGIRA